MHIDPAIAALVCTCGALLFGTAALHKFRDLRHFAAGLAAYRLMPAWVAPLLGPLFPVAEAGVTAGLLVARSRQTAALAGAVLLLGYAAAIAINLHRGRRDLACGCGGPNDRRPIAPWMVWRNIVIAVVLLFSVLPFGSRALEWTDAVTIGFGSLTCAVIYACLDRVLVPTAHRRARVST